MQLTTKQAFGVEIPALGFGTWQLKGDKARAMTAAALDMGYRLIDTAQLYANELEVGQGLRDAGLAREDYFLTTKVWRTQHTQMAFRDSIRTSLDALGVAQVDMLMLHWPDQDVPLHQLLDWLAEAREQGLTKHLGICNHNAAQLRDAVRYLGAGVLLNVQAEYHLLLSQQTLLAEVAQQGLLFTAFCPLAQGAFFGQPLVKRLAAKHDKSEAQLALRWLIEQPGVLAIPRSSSEAHARNNLDVFGFALDDEDKMLLAGLQGDFRQVNPDYAPAWDRP